MNESKEIEMTELNLISSLGTESVRGGESESLCVMCMYFLKYKYLSALFTSLRVEYNKILP